MSVGNCTADWPGQDSRGGGGVLPILSHATTARVRPPLPEALYLSRRNILKIEVDKQ